MSDINDVADFLKVLGLSTTRIPTFQEYKKSYREQIKKHPHPDHGGDTGEFQTITEAATHVFEYITKHQHEKTRTDSDSDKNLLEPSNSPATWCTIRAALSSILMVQ